MTIGFLKVLPNSFYEIAEGSAEQITLTVLPECIKWTVGQPKEIEKAVKIGRYGKISSSATGKVCTKSQLLKAGYL